jgi:hypothetical protein
MGICVISGGDTDQEVRKGAEGFRLWTVVLKLRLSSELRQR